MNSTSITTANFTTGIFSRTGIIISVILVLLLCAIILFTISKRKNRINTALGIIGMSLIAFTLASAVFFTESGILLLHTNGNPADSVYRFYSLALEGNYEESYKCLKDYTTLGLENSPSDNYSERIYAALKDSYRFELSGPAVIDQFTATQNIRFSYLEIAAISEAISAEIDNLLEERIETLPWHQIYDDEGNYRTALLDEVYDSAFDIAMKNADNYIVTTEYPVTLEYIGDTWYVLVSDDMTYCFAGGTK